MSEDNPFATTEAPAEEDNPFATRVRAAETAPAAEAPTVDWADVGKGFAGGVGRGVTGTIGLPGTVGGWVHGGLSKLGVPEAAINQAAAVARVLAPATAAFSMPDANQVQQAVEGYTGKFYEPTTVPGQYASTVGEFLPAALTPGGEGSLAKTAIAKAADTIIPALTSETMGQWTKGTAAEPYARAIGGVLGGLGGAKVITPTAPAPAQYQAAVKTLTDAGVPLTAAERTGSNALRWLETTAGDMPLSSEAYSKLLEKRAEGFDKAITNQLFDRAELAKRGVPADQNLPSPRVFEEGKKSLSDEFKRLSAAHQLKSDPQLVSDLYAATDKYNNNVLPSLRGRDFEDVRDDIVNKLVANQGRLPGDQYQAIRSRLGTLGNSAQGSNPYLASAFKDMRDALDNAMSRSLPSGLEKQAWDLNRERWGNMKQLVPAIGKPGEGAAHLSPQAVAQAARTGRAEQAITQSGSMDKLNQAAAQVMKRMPQSGTAARTGWMTLFNMKPWLLTGGSAAAGLPFGPVGAMVTAAAPHVVPRLAVSRPGQAYLGNQFLPQNTRDILAQTMLQQATTWPSVQAKNEAEAAAYDPRQPTKVYIHKYRGQ